MKRNLFLAVLLLYLAACSGTEDKGAENTGPVEPGEQRALALSSNNGCVLDDDCAAGSFCFQRTCSSVCADDSDCDGGICSDRGRCIDEQGEQEIQGTIIGVKIKEFPNPVQVVKKNQASVTFEFGLTDHLPPEGLASRVWRSDDLSDPSRVRFLHGEDSFSISLPVGDASPDGENPRPVSVTLFTALGDIDLVLVPEPALEGLWQGSVEVEQFGAQAFPLEIHLIGDEPSSMKAALPLRQASLFSPRKPAQLRDEFETVELKYHSNLDAYQAIFHFPFELRDGIFADFEAGQVERILRFDFDAKALEEGRVEGRFLDRWEGLYNEQRSDGRIQRGALEYIGRVELHRTGSLPDQDAEYTSSTANFKPDPAPIERQAVQNCAASNFEVEPVERDDGQRWHCDEIDDVASFESASAQQRTLCALAVSHSASLNESTADQLSAFFAQDGSEPDISFEDFLKACADDDDPLCQPSTAAICAFDLIGYSAPDISADFFDEDPAMMRQLRNELMMAFVEMSREAFLARQLGAFYTDMDLRRDWLRQSSAPTVFLNAVEEANKNLLEDWQERVLDIHQALFIDMFSTNALTFMSRPANDVDVNERRRGLLQEASTLWRSYAEALLLGARRWNDVLRDNADRKDRVEFLQQRANELYLTMGMLMAFNRAAGASAQSALLVSDFAALIEAIESLGQTFDEALFARDAEVVTARSLNPLSDNSSLLRERGDQARTVVQQTLEEINAILDDVTIEALQEQEMRNRMENDRRQAANAVARLCGMPAGCREDDLLTNPTCVNTELGACGMLDPAEPDSAVTFDPARVGGSKAGSAILDVLEAFHNVAIQRDELEGHLQKLDLEYEELNAFRHDVEQWNQMRLQGVQQLAQNLARRKNLRDRHLVAMIQNLEERATIRQEQIDSMRDRFSEWNQMRIEGAHSSFADNIKRMGLRRGADFVEMAGQQVAGVLDYAGKSLPTTVGLSNDVSAPARAALWLSARTVEWSTGRVADGMRIAAETLELMAARNSALGAAKVAAMEEQAELNSAIAQADIDQLRESMEQSEKLNKNEIEQLKETIQLMEAQLEAELAYARDMAEFRQRRTEHLKNHIETSGRLLRLERSRFNVLQRTAEYDAIVNEARLEAARLKDLDQQLTNLDGLVGGMAAIFSQSHTLERAERHLQQARQALMEWLVVLEYYAVRPFFEQRIQIMLARNAFQLEAIAENLASLEQSCGGSERSIAATTLSLRDDILGLTRAVESNTTQDIIEADERFRRWLTESHIPVDRRIRWSTSSSLSNILEKNKGVLAATFLLRLDNFANLPLACNGKIDSISLQVVGDVGEVRPVVSLLYDGTSQLRSCQPDIDDYVRAFGQGLTSYGTITQLRTEGRSMSPLAGINEFPSTLTDVNHTLAGLPVASEYTLLIDTDVGDNSRVNWDALEDIRIRVSYSYQDLFPTACN